MSEQRFFRFLRERIGLDVESVGASMSNARCANVAWLRARWTWTITGCACSSRQMSNRR